MNEHGMGGLTTNIMLTTIIMLAMLYGPLEANALSISSPRPLASSSSSTSSTSCRRSFFLSTASFGSGAALLVTSPRHSSAAGGGLASSSSCNVEALRASQAALEKLEPLAVSAPAQFEAQLGVASGKTSAAMVACSAGAGEKDQALAAAFLEHAKSAIYYSKRPRSDAATAKVQLAAAQADLAGLLRSLSP